MYNLVFKNHKIMRLNYDHKQKMITFLHFIMLLQNHSKDHYFICTKKKTILKRLNKIIRNIDLHFRRHLHWYNPNIPAPSYNSVWQTYILLSNTTNYHDLFFVFYKIFLKKMITLILQNNADFYTRNFNFCFKNYE